ncbi:unnamed protein product [Mytilus edulis]|uniref:C-type lectin domain-containing protein n=2 Tax=Mytilus edulis TaxID=6550 RepID=A0A8S3R7Q5_MYTED|nr:unnamed protein product [Mytilus edulis]
MNVSCQYEIGTLKTAKFAPTSCCCQQDKMMWILKVIACLVVCKAVLGAFPWKKINGRCYHYSEDKQNWFTAERKCREIGGYLAKIEDAAENTILYDNRPQGINGGHLWIGLSDLDEGQFRWSIDQELATNVNWVSWHKASDPGHNCVSMYYIGPSWLDWRCSSEFGYVCETDFCF